jgi:hypothetical protein
MTVQPELSEVSRPELGQGQRAGTVTRLSNPPPAPPVPPAAAGTPAGPAGPNNRRTLLWFGGTAATVAVIGLVVVLAVVLNGHPDSFWSRQAAPPDTRPPLARLCPPPTAVPQRDPATGPVPAVPSGPRTVDKDSGISYQKYGAPWQPWDTVWTKGTLEVSYKAGQHFISEVYEAGTYHASILSAAVPVAENDGLLIDLACVGRQVAADVRAEYYPQPNRMELMSDRQTVLGGRPAWVTKFRLHFSEAGLQAKDELAAVALIDVGRPQAAILYVSIPGTHRQFDWVVDDVLPSVRPA